MASDWERSAVALTEEALRAAERGDWTIVQHCYAGRQDLLEQHSFSAQTAQRLSELDETIYLKAYTARSAVVVLLDDAAAMRRTFHRLAHPSAQGRARYVDGHI